MEAPGLHYVDWIIFAVMLLLSSGIGLYHACTGGKQKTTEEYLRGGGQIGVLGASLSLTVSFISSILILGYPAEIYTFGSQYWVGTFGWAVLAPIISATVYVPVLYPLQTTTSNEYIQLRFKSRIMQLIIAIYTIVQSIFYAAIVTFGQATAIEAVSGFAVWKIILVAIAAAVFYTSLGGLRGVIWTDVFQTIIMLTGLSAVVIVGFTTVGGFNEVFRINGEWKRLNFLEFDPNPTMRLNFWGLIFGNALTGASVKGHRQEGYQRYAAMPTMTKAVLVVLLCGPFGFVLSTLACMVGWSMFAYFAELGCDPLKAGYISNPNQLVPYFVATVFDTPGLAGLFLACVGAGALSTISSVLNGSTAIAWNDIIKPHTNLSDRKATIISKILVVIFGVGVIILSIFVERLGGNIVQMIGTFSSAIAGPMSGVFLVGMFFPWSNWKGASLGCALGTIFTLWVGFGSYSIDRHLSKLPTNIANCTADAPLFNSTEFTHLGTYSIQSTTALPQTDELQGLDRLYALSFLWMREVATSITILVTIVVSFMTGPTDPSSVEPRLLHPCLRKCIKSKVEEDTKDLKTWNQEDAIEKKEKQSMVPISKEMVDISPKRTEYDNTLL